MFQGPGYGAFFVREAQVAQQKWWMQMLKDYGLALVIVLPLVFGYNFFFRGEPVSEGNAPALILMDLQGEVVDLTRLRSEAYVINFWTTWCGPCKQEIPEISAWARENPDVTVLGVSVDLGMDLHKLRGISNRLGIDYPVVHDVKGKAAHAWNVQVYPTTFVLDEDLNVVATRIGVVNSARLDRMVDQAR